MKVIISLFVAFLFLIACQPEPQSRIQINIPSAKTEAAYIWRTIQDIQFFEEHNYQVSLPRGPLVDALKQKAKSNSLSDEDYERLEKFVEDSVYNEADYRKGFGKIEDASPLINEMIGQIGASKFNWKFKAFESYPVNLTLYGPGGSYNPDEGSILIYTTPTGQFKSYDDPANTIIHEIIHIGIEESIIAAYDVPHALKERIVDNIVAVKFGQYLPDYKVQNMGDTRIDQYLKDVEDISTLDESVQQILQE